MPPEEETNPQYLQIVLCFFPSTGVACCQASSSGLPFLAVFEAGAAYLKKKIFTSQIWGGYLRQRIKWNKKTEVILELNKC